MTLQVNGSDLHDIRRQVAPPRDPWISIENIWGSDDFGRAHNAKKDGYKISWRGYTESFTKIVFSTAELLAIVKELSAKRDEGIRRRIAAEEAKKKQERERRNEQQTKHKEGILRGYGC